MTSRAIAPLRLRRVPKADAKRLNALFAPRRALDTGHGFVLRDHRAGKVALGPQPVRIDLVVSETKMVLYCPHALFAALMVSLQLDAAASAQQPPAEIAALLIERALDPVLTGLEAATGMTISVASISPSKGQPTGTIRLLAVEAFQATWPLVLSGPLAALDLLMGYWPTAPQNAPEISVPAFIRLGATDLTADIIYGLNIGDAVLFERRAGGPASGKLVLANHFLADAVWNGSWRLLNAPSVKHRGRSGWLAEHSAPVANPSSDDFTLQASDIPMTLCFDLAPSALPLKEMRALKAGSIVDLPTIAESAIRLTVDGQCIGKGDLIQVEGKSGVRVLKMFHHE